LFNLLTFLQEWLAFLGKNVLNARNGYLLLGKEISLNYKILVRKVVKTEAQE